MVRELHVKSVLNRLKKRDSWFLVEYSLNAYEGCAFNCIYCYIRGSKYGENLGPGLGVKANAPYILEKQLRPRAKKGEHGFIAISSASDPYQPIEEDLCVTRKLLKVILTQRFPVSILTRSALVLRDLDLLKDIDAAAVLPESLKKRPGRGVMISTSISTLDEKLAKLVEPGAPPPAARLDTIRKCKEAGFFAGINFMPVLPFISDTEEKLEGMVRAALDCGADFIFVAGMTLFGSGPGDSRTLYYNFIRRNHPELIPKYDALFGEKPYPSWEYQKRIGGIADALCRKHGVRLGISESYRYDSI
jgi:DNA repair photolyase